MRVGRSKVRALLFGLTGLLFAAALAGCGDGTGTAPEPAASGSTAATSATTVKPGLLTTTTAAPPLTTGTTPPTVTRVLDDAQKDRALASFSKGTAGYYYGSPLFRAGYVYIGTSSGPDSSPAPDNSFYRLDAGLKLLWEYPLGTDEVRGTADLDGEGNVYFTVQSGRTKGDTSGAAVSVCSLDKYGKFRWKAPVIARGLVPADRPIELTVGGHVYVAGDAFYVLDLATGQTIAKSPGVTNGSKPLMDSQGRVYVESATGTYCFTAEGRPVWSYQPKGDAYLGAVGYSSPAFQPGATRVIVLDANWIYALDSATGRLVWKFDTKARGETRAKPSVDDKGNIYVCTISEDGPSTFSAVKADGSGLMWTRGGFGGAPGSPVIGDAGIVYFGTEGRLRDAAGTVVPGIHALDTATGTISWEAVLDGDVADSPTMAPDGTLYVALTGDAGRPGMVVALASDSNGPLPNAGGVQLTDE